MPKQIKVGFDKTIGPKVVGVQPLLDYGSALPLKNINDQPLYTEELGALDGFYSSAKALSTHVNNQDFPLKVAEQFKETTQVSSSLLGVPRAEQQLGLFSDVSVYGFNNNIWEFYAVGGLGIQPREWVTRKNKTYGRRQGINPVEIAEEQAIALTAFPISWSYPFDINFGKLNLYNDGLYENYRRFFELGRYMYDSFTNDYTSELYENFAKENFLPPWVGTVEDVTGPTYNDEIVTVKTVIYNPNVSIDLIFEEIEKWTMAWIKMRDGLLFLPNGLKVDFPKGEDGNYIYDPSNTRPGYSSSSGYFGRIESKKAFRYQPGRISGFTFGLRASFDRDSLNNYIEWGAANATDQYMFQIKGPNFSIVRRSTVALPDQNILDMGIDPEEQISYTSNENQTFDPDTGASIPGPTIFELVIKRDFFNVDRLDGTGPSGYNLDIQKVTMYKIEFSWYGAVGAKFYAYVPSENDEARWVLMHTLVIENKIGQPCLNDPYFKFRYTMNIVETSNLVSPQYVYKYGASYYIDGGDEGSSVSYSLNSDEVDISNINTKSILGLSPRNTIKNREGEAVKNKKDVIPSSISITTDNPIRVDVIECEGCPGFGHHFAPSLENGQVTTEDSFSFSSDGKSFAYVDTNKSFLPSDVNKKLVGNGIYGTYIYKLSDDLSTAFIMRKPGRNQENDNEGISEASNTYTYQYTKKVQLYDGQLADVRANTFNLRLVGYDSIAASAVPLTKPNIDVNFLNDGKIINKSYCNFYIGVTTSTYAPSIVSNELVFGGQPHDANNTLFAEWSEGRVGIQFNGVEISESENRYGTVFEIEPQIPKIGGVDSGVCSRMSIRVTEFEVDAEYIADFNNVTGSYLKFQDLIFDTLNGLKGGQIGIINTTTGEYEGSTTYFDQEKAQKVNIPNEGIRYIIKINNSDIQANVEETGKIVFRVVRIYGRYVNKTKVFSAFNIYPLYVVVGMADNAKINNITIEEYDTLSKFSYSPTWLTSASSSISVLPSGNDQETLTNNGIFLSGGDSLEDSPPSNFIEIDRLSSILVDKQLQQPLRGGFIRSTFFLGENETKEIDLGYLYGQDRYLLTPGLYNTKATFFTAKALQEPAKTQITLNVKEQ